MSMFNIGVDADGVLTNMSEFYREYGTKFFGKEPVDMSGYDISTMFGVSKEMENKFGLRYFPLYITKIPPRDDVHYLNKLANEGAHLYEITARKFVTMNNVLGAYSRGCFENWLVKNNLEIFDSIEYCSEENTPRDKLIACSKLNVDVMIEDKPDVAFMLATNGVKVLLFDAPYNQGLSHENILRVKNFEEVYNAVKAIQYRYLENEDDNFRILSKDERKKLSSSENISYIKRYRSYVKNLKTNSAVFDKIKFKFKFAYNLVRVPYSIAFNAKLSGKENIPYQDGLIIASNHLNSYDQFYISKALGSRQFYGLAASTIRNTIRGRLCNFLECAIFIDREDSESKSKGELEAIDKLANNTSILIFPEGTRKNKTEEGREQLQLPFKMGAVSMAQKTGAPILPVSLYYGENDKYIKFGEVQFVKPEDDLCAANKMLEDTISSMTLQSIDEDKKVKTMKRGK